MQILCLNFGTASLKFAVFSVHGEVRIEGHLGSPANVEEALQEVRQQVATAHARIDAIGQRVVHGGSRYSQPARYDDGLDREIERLLPLAPQHNLLALRSLRGAARLWPGVPQVAVFDTAFHRSMPEAASCYAVPQAWRQAGVRRHGFHGLSHQHVMEAVASRVGVDAGQLRIISLHLGNGASACAIDRGRSVDTSMGLTPLEGLVMGTRCGDLDPGVAGYVERTLNLPLSDIETALYEESGMKALSGLGADMRRIEAAAALGEERANLAMHVYAYRVRKYIGAYAAAMGGCDALAFTGGVGENSPKVRALVLQDTEFLGFRLDPARNSSPAFGADGVAALHGNDSAVPLFAVRAREEWMIAREARRLLVDMS